MRTLSLAVLTIALAACSGAGTGSPPAASPPATGAPADVASEGPDFGAIEHPTGPLDIVLQFEEGGGFVMPAWLATQAPSFTLFGDGTIVFRNTLLDPLEPIGSVNRLRPFRIAKLSEEQIQEVLADALGVGGLGVARPDYPNDQISDASTAVFTINAGGLKKTVSIYALGLEMDGMADGPARAAFAQLAERLQDIDDGGAFPTAEYVPETYRGVLLEGQPGVPDAKPWPWSDIEPADFVSDGDPNAFQIPKRLMSAAELEVLGIDPHQGGFQNLTLVGLNDGSFYSFSVRPLLPGETS